MRDDSRVEIFILCVLGAAFLVYGAFAFWRGADDRAWELRWASLDPLDRAWIAAASRSSASRPTLEERGEYELAKGFGRREMRRRAYILLAMVPPFLILTILMLTGLVSDRFAPVVFGSFALLQALVGFFRDRRIKNRYRETQDRYLVAHPAEPAPGAPARPHMPEMPAIPAIPTVTGGKLVSGTLNGGGPEINVATMNGDVTLRKL